MSMQRLTIYLFDSKAKGKGVAAVLVLAVLLLATVSATFAWRNFNEHKTNLASGHYQEEEIPISFGVLTITKTVRNMDGSDLTDLQKEGAFEFTVTFSDDGTYEYQIGNVTGTLTSGEKLYLRHGERAVFSKIPVGVTYTVVETKANGYVTQSNDHQGTMTVFGALVDYINTYRAGDEGSLIVTKEVINADGSSLTASQEGKEFTFVANIGGVFYTFSLRDGGQKVFTGLPVGATYTVTENDYTGDGYQTPVRTYSGVITISEEGVTIPFVNVFVVLRDEMFGDLTIEKKVTGQGADPDAEFIFEITFDEVPEGSHPISLGGQLVNLTQENRVFTFTLKNFQTLVCTGIPHGVTYTVVETGMDAYFVAGVISAEGMIVGDVMAYVPFTNHWTPPLSKLTVAKIVTGHGANPDDEFEITVTIGDMTEVIYLKAGRFRIYEDIPVGTPYVITEADYTEEGYTTAPASRGFTGMMPADDIMLSFVNAFDDGSDLPGNLSITKTVVDESGLFDLDTPFIFTVTFDNLPEGETSVLIDEVLTNLSEENRKFVFPLRYNESVHITGIPKGVRYTVEETLHPDFKTALKLAGVTVSTNKLEGVITPGYTDDIVCINTLIQPEEVKLTIKKLIRGDVPAKDVGRYFRFLIQVEGREDEIIPLRADQSYTIKIPVGATYTVTEIDLDQAEGWALVRVTDGQGTAYDDVVAQFTNSYARVFITISGEKIWDLTDAPDGVELPSSIIVNLYDGDTVVQVATVRPDQDGNWSYTFKAPKYRADHETEIVYTVVEVPFANWEAIYEGHDIVNRYSRDETITVSVQKVWRDNDDPDRPKSIVVALFKDGQRQHPAVALDESNDWMYSWVDLINDGIYTVDEVLVPRGYTKTVTGDATTGFVIVNAKGQEPPERETIVIEGRKTWDHGDNPATDHPTSLILLIKANGEFIMQKQITAADQWRWRLEFARFDVDGNEIVYTVDEALIIDYTKKIEGYSITNTYSPGTDTGDPGNDFGNPKTGDDLSLAFALIALVISAVLIGYEMRRRYVRRETRGCG